jgi:hypothetical protein
MKKIALAALFLGLGSAQAKPLSSQSPASMYKVESQIYNLSLTPSRTSYETGNSEIKKDKFDTSLTGIYKLPSKPIQLGLNLFHEKAKAEEGLTVTADVAYAINDIWCIGFELAPKMSLKGERKTSWDSALGLIYHKDSIELGIGYKEEIYNGEQSLAWVNRPKSIGIHGKQKITQALTGLVEFRAIFPERHDLRAVIYDAKTKFSYRMSPDLGVKASLAYQESSYGETKYMSTSNLGKMAYAVGADYSLSPNLSVSAELEYARGRDSNQLISYKKTAWSPEIGFTWVQ